MDQKFEFGLLVGVSAPTAEELAARTAAFVEQATELGIIDRTISSND